MGLHLVMIVFLCVAAIAVLAGRGDDGDDEPEPHAAERDARG